MTWFRPSCQFGLPDWQDAFEMIGNSCADSQPPQDRMISERPNDISTRIDDIQRIPCLELVGSTSVTYDEFWQQRCRALAPHEWGVNNFGA